VVATQKDHEGRLRGLERKIYAVPSIGVLLGLLAIGKDIFT
jgi:hypothetical protein